ncbi:MAG: hypothetical protein IPL64_04395 [Flavobacteriales bacterium]|nr:hypothetical protein [Flavobacteriales bacterium]
MGERWNHRRYPVLLLKGTSTPARAVADLRVSWSWQGRAFFAADNGVMANNCGVPMALRPANLAGTDIEPVNDYFGVGQMAVLNDLLAFQGTSVAMHRCG